MLVSILILISSKSWGVALCGYEGRMFDAAGLHQSPFLLG
jgi:hypothetical protein